MFCIHRHLVLLCFRRSARSRRAARATESVRTISWGDNDQRIDIHIYVYTHMESYIYNHIMVENRYKQQHIICKSVRCVMFLTLGCDSRKNKYHGRNLHAHPLIQWVSGLPSKKKRPCPKIETPHAALNK